MPGFARTPGPRHSGDGDGVSELSSPCGDWRLTVRRLGTSPEPTDEMVVIARIDAGGTMTVLTGGPAGEPRFAGWRSAGPRRVVLVAEWFVRDAAARAVGWVSVTAAAELSASGRTCRARLQWHHVDLAGLPHGATATGEADGTRLHVRGVGSDASPESKQRNRPDWGPVDHQVDGPSDV